MNKMKWLIRRELWENKGSLVWAPTIVAGAIGALATLAALSGRQITIDGVEAGEVLIQGAPRDHLVSALAHTYLGSSLPLLLMLSMLVFFYCLGALADERRDRSILFWKSLPVSDLETVLSKALVALVVAPLITIMIGFALSLFVLILICLVLALHGTQLAGAILATPAFYQAPLVLLGMLPVYLLWALPTVGWLLLVSSIVRSRVFLWAVGTPLVLALLMLWAEKMFHLGFDTGWFVHHVVDRILLGVVPGAWFLFTLEGERQIELEQVTATLDGSQVLHASWQTLAGPAAWAGALAGVAMLAAAVWMRRHREDG